MHGNQEIQELRPKRNTLNPDIPYHFLHEEEPDAAGVLQKVNTIFLTGKECSFKCLMCDLWKNTLATPTPKGAIVNQNQPRPEQPARGAHHQTIQQR